MDLPPKLQGRTPLLDAGAVEDLLASSGVQPPTPTPSPRGPPHQGPRGFQLKHLNIMDPLLATNNLGRSVSKASFSRIRKALAHGARTLTTILHKVGRWQGPVLHKVKCHPRPPKNSFQTPKCHPSPNTIDPRRQQLTLDLTSWP